MSILIVDSGKYQPDNMIHAFKVEFNTSAHMCFNALETIQYLESHIKNVEVIIFNTNHVNDIIHPIVQYIKENGPQISTLHLTQIKKSHPYIDLKISKPVKMQDILNGIFHAYKIHMQKTKNIIWISQNAINDHFEFCNIITTLQPTQLDLIKARGVMIDTTSIDNSTADKIKKSLQGHSMPIAMYGIENSNSRKLFSIATDIYSEQLSIKEAFKLYEIASAKFMHRKFLIQNAKMYMQLNEYKQTISRLKFLLSIEPRYSMAHTFLGNCYRKLNQDQNAQECYEKAIQYNPFNPENYLRILELNPSNSDILNKAKHFCPNIPSFHQIKNESEAAFAK